VRLNLEAAQEICLKINENPSTSYNSQWHCLGTIPWGNDKSSVFIVHFITSFIYSLYWILYISVFYFVFILWTIKIRDSFYKVFLLSVTVQKEYSQKKQKQIISLAHVASWTKTLAKVELYSVYTPIVCIEHSFIKSSFGNNKKVKELTTAHPQFLNLIWSWYMYIKKRGEMQKIEKRNQWSGPKKEIKCNVVPLRCLYESQK
jgi:hypothetical protein